eukprot:CAMPEP_0194209554 /NCGR_PEP_ID=MMETSP0156-20130528/7641_1 /TAXON_ID=33649 /ORGANISM="Thalassionema nitzschioides, Strain L26-B" /LENGTH=365 /DNA_ID=CAMNT_0038936747 /DNA_START=18 /DNA_END=1112 /DNA_ORIENTATION=-
MKLHRNLLAFWCFLGKSSSFHVVHLLRRNLPTTTPLYAGGGFGSGGATGKSKKGKTLSTKKKLQIKERVLKDYGGDIQKGTDQRMKDAMAALPDHIQSIAELYKKIVRWDAYIASISEDQKAKLPPRDVDGAKNARAQLESFLNEYSLGENDLHNIFQKITWDASADAKAANAAVGKMPAHIEERVDKACEVVAEAVKTKGRKDGRLLDVGTGHGALIPNLIKAGLYASQITGIDLSTEMIRNAKETYRVVNFIAMDFLEFSPDDGFDGILFCSSLHDLPDMKGSLAKAASLLRSDGKMVILHAQGGMHVVGQVKANPVMVKRKLPPAEELEAMANELNLTLEHEPAEAGSTRDEEEGYLAILKK